jgi:enediyne biosynthesis protein E4
MQISKAGIFIASLIAVSAFVIGCSDNKQEQKKTEQPVFRSLPSSQTGIKFRNDLTESYDTYFDLFAYVYNGAGVGIGDINNDGLADIYFTGNEVSNKLYLNKGGLQFEDVTDKAGVGGNGKWNNGVTMVDINADGWLDIYVCKGGWHDEPAQRKNLLFINQGDLTFKEQAADFGLDESGYSIHASFFDLDNDNDLDVYVTNRPDSFDLPLSEMVRQKKLSPTFSRDKLFVNNNQKFTEVGAKAGISNNFGYALSVVTSDLNNDGYSDIYVANDFAEGDYMYINQGNGTFRERIKEATNHISMYSMGTDVADINNDGLEDIMVSEMLPEDYKRSKVSMPSMDVEGFWNIVNGGMHKQYMHNALHLNHGNLFFGDIAQLAGVAKTEWSWSVLMSDFDNDGDRDIYVANGYKRDVFDGDVHHKIAAFVRANMDKYPTPEDLMTKGFKDFINVYEPIKVKSYLFSNNGNLQFTNTSESWGITKPAFSNGAAVGDLDNDGDVDLVVNNIDDEAFVYENTSTANYLKVKLEGPEGNGTGIGAKISVHASGKLQYFENKTVRGYLSSTDPVAHFGLGSVPAVDSVVILWPDGKRSVAHNIKANQQLSISWKESKERKSTAAASPYVLAANDLVAPNYVHKENIVNEYKDQVLLPHGFAQSGPFLAVGDVDGDGQDDFYIGGSSGKAGALYIQKDERFTLKKVPAFSGEFEDAEAEFFDADGDKDLDLYVASSGAEFADGSEKYQDRIYINNGKGDFTRGQLPKTASSGSAVVVFDADADGDLDIFRGGQVTVGRYPKIPRSYLLINEKGTFADKTREVAPLLQEPGMVKSAEATDLNGDQKPELIITGEWMPIRVFSNINGKLEEVSDQYVPAQTEGWWSKVVVNDIDNDGDNDLLLGNIGENYKFKPTLEKPFHVYASDFDGNGTNDVFLARYLPDSTLVPIRGRECTSQQMPVIAQKFPTFVSFANSDLAGILGNRNMESALHYKAYTFSSVVAINESGKLNFRRLPVETQLSCINGFIVHDFDGDGKKDVLLAGNKFDVEVETTPADASPGWVLKGDGSGNFEVLKPAQSGFFVPYNVKDVRLVKTGLRWSVLVASNSDLLRAFRLNTLSGATPASP